MVKHRLKKDKLIAFLFYCYFTVIHTVNFILCNGERKLSFLFCMKIIKHAFYHPKAKYKLNIQNN